MNGGSVFVDTNVLLYALDRRDERKFARADAWITCLWNAGAGRLSWQVLHEFYANATKRLRVPATGARSYVEMLNEWRPADSSFPLIQRAWHWCDHARLAYWDGLIVAAAEQLDCAWLLSEDFQEGRRFGTVTVVNPFHREPQEFGLG